MKRRIRLLFFASLWTLSISLASQAQKFWEKKPYQEWTFSEAAQILLSSPWAQTYRETVHIAYGDPVSTYSVIIRLHSALPVRQAHLRKKQIQMNYDRFTVADKARFDNETRAFLECPDCAKFYIVTISSPVVPEQQLPNSRIEMSFDIVGELKDLALRDVKPFISLQTDTGEMRELVGFKPPTKEGGEAMFVFPRFDQQGKPLITTTNKKFYFKIDEKLFEKRSVPMKSFTFEVARLTLNGEVVF